ncbi:MAG: FAD:protein FMN transferase [Candidatus Brocadiia bacterium]
MLDQSASRVPAILAVVMFVPLIAGCERQLTVQPDRNVPGVYVHRTEMMGTDATIRVRASGIGQARQFIADAVDALNRVEERMSTYRRDSDISRLNRYGAEQQVRVSQLTSRVLSRARHFSELTDGAFDVTYAPLRSLWRRAQKSGKVPEEDEVESTLELVGYEQLSLDRGKARLQRDGMEIDPGGLAKGFAIDRAVATLREQGCRDALVDVGGDIGTLGERSDESPWAIRVRDPREKTDSPIVLRLTGMAVATSGNYARFFRIGERTFSHIIDPRTGYPVNSVPSVTVIAPETETADALATAISVMGADKGMTLVESIPETECLIMSRTKTTPDQDIVSVDSSRNFSAYVEDTDDR